MKQKKLLALLLLSIYAPTALAKDNARLEHANAKSSDKMPALVSPQMADYEHAKKILDEAYKEPSIGKKLSASVDLIKNAAASLLNRAQSAPQKGDPKTIYSQSENQLHSKAPSKAPSNYSQRHLDLTRSLTSASYFYTSDTTIQANYYNPADPYNQVIVVYDANTKEPLSATGYLITNLESVPDLSGMTLVSSAVRADGTVAIQRFQSPPDDRGAYTQLALNYDSNGNVTSITQTIVQPLDLKKVKVPGLS